MEVLVIYDWIQFGIKVPQSVCEALLLDLELKNDLWARAIQKEMDGLNTHKCCIYKLGSWKPPRQHQYAPLCMIFMVRPDLQRKAHLVIGGHVIDSEGHSTYALMVKLQSICLLNIITKANGLRCLSGDVGNAYLNATTEEKIYTRCSPEFREHQGCIVIIHKALYGLQSSACRWHAHLADTLHSMGFTPSRFNHDVWLKGRGDNKGYDYICTYVDDFMIMAKDPDQYIKTLCQKYSIHDIQTPEDYLSVTCIGTPNSKWSFSFQTYIKEAASCIECITECL